MKSINGLANPPKSHTRLNSHLNRKYIITYSRKATREEKEEINPLSKWTFIDHRGERYRTIHLDDHKLRSYRLVSRRKTKRRLNRNSFKDERKSNRSDVFSNNNIEADVRGICHAVLSYQLTHEMPLTNSALTWATAVSLIVLSALVWPVCQQDETNGDSSQPFQEERERERKERWKEERRISCEKVRESCRS